MNEQADSPISAQVTHPPPVERFRKWGTIAWSTIGVLILAWMFFWALTRVTEIFPPLVIALITLYILNPLVARLEGVGVRRIFGSCFTYLVLIGIVAVLLLLLIPALVEQGQAFARDLPQTVDRIGEMATGVDRAIETRFNTEVNVREWIGGRSDLIEDSLTRVGGFLRGAVQTFTLIIIGLILGFYLLVDLPQLRRAALRLIPPERRDETIEVAASVGTAMGGFFRGQLLVALIVAIMSAVGLAIVGLPYWLVVGLIAGFFNLVPLIGPFVGAIPAILIAAALRPPITILKVVIVLLVVQQIDNHFISPNVMRLTVRLHPVTVMISLIAGATLAGFWGMLLAVPVVASAKVIAGHVWRTRVPWGEDVFEDTQDMEAIPDEQAPPHTEVLARAGPDSSPEEAAALASEAPARPPESD